MDPAQTLRPPTVADGTALWELAAATGVLDVNSAYAYVLWCRDFSASSIVATVPGDRGGSDRVVGFITGYRRPDAPTTLFVWQVAVDDACRGQGLAARMLLGLAERLATVGVDSIEATVAPSNEASLRLFTSVARQLGVTPVYPASGGFSGDQLPGDHEDEPLFAIGPF